MKKRAILILITFILGSAGMLSPVCHALAAAQDVKTESEAGKGAEKESEKDNKGIGETIYEKVDQAVRNLVQDQTIRWSKRRRMPSERKQRAFSRYYGTVSWTDSAGWSRLYSVLQPAERGPANEYI